MARQRRQDTSSVRPARGTGITAPIAHALRFAGLLSVLAGLIWPIQAAALAWAIAGWIAGDMGRTPWAAAIFVAGGFLRAFCDHRAGQILFDAADQTISHQRAALITREARARAPLGSAEIAALIVQKLPLLQPWITRYSIAMIKVAVLPLVLLLISFWFSWIVGLVLLVAGPLIPVFMILIGMAAEQASRRQMDEIGSMNAMVMDRLSAMLDIRLLGAADKALADFSDRAEALRIKTMAVLRIAFLSSTVLELFSAIGVAMVAVFVGFTLLGEITFGSWSAPLSLGEGLFLLLIAPDFFQPFRELAAAWHDRAAGLSVLAELDALDGAERAPFLGEARAARPLDGPLTLSLAGVVAALPGRRVTLPDFSLKRGQSLALIGESGAGKSTGLAALAGLVPLADGQITVCGHRLDHETADAWRARIALVPQRPHFPDQPLYAWLDPDKRHTDPWPALKRAEVDQVVLRLPYGLRTRLGETGGGVSGGEARRLMIARAILSGRELILADEPTADLDPDTAAMIIRALMHLKENGHSVIVATHDPDLAALMDRRVEVGQ
ncbi:MULTISPECIES: ABC transporter ATP-binding protein/permease [Iodidimonas]|uniref:ABC transporter ATP-binding protein/permease n=1 Tax=Iodidimonas TaxID=2066486 RepID=UPI001B2FE549|nr:MULTISPECIES: ATP-binding cassette domain-containing protein [Iodidimonas]